MSWIDWLRKQVTANDLDRETPHPTAATASSATEQALDALRTDAPYNRCSHRVTKLLSRIYFELSEFHKPDSRP